MTDGRFLLAPVRSAGADWASARSVLLSPVPVSATQLSLLRFIADHQRRTGRTPSYGQMDAFCYPHTGATVSYQMRQLVAKGLIDHAAGRRRGITLNVAP